MKGKQQETKKQVVTTISYPQELDEKVRALAKETHRSRSGMICEIVSLYFKPAEAKDLSH